MRKNIKLGLICLTSLLLAGCRDGIRLYFPGSGSGSAPSSGSGSTPTIPGPGPLPDPDSGSSDSSNQQNKVTLTLDPAGGTINGSTEPVVNEYDVGTTVELPLPTRRGYTFKAWEYNGTALTDDTGNSLTAWNLTQDVTLTASYVAINYTLNFKFTSVDDTIYASKTFNFDMDLNDALENDFASTKPAPNLPAPIWGWYTEANYNTDNFITTKDDLDIDEVNKTITVYSTRAFTPGDTKSIFTVENGVLKSSVASNVPTDLNLNHLFVEGKRITGIEAGAFTGNTTLTTIYIPKSVTKIDSGALSSLSSLTTIRLERTEDQKPIDWNDDWTGKTLEWGQ